MSLTHKTAKIAKDCSVVNIWSTVVRWYARLALQRKIYAPTPAILNNTLQVSRLHHVMRIDHQQKQHSYSTKIKEILSRHSA